jgi:hypothetical protein
MGDHILYLSDGAEGWVKLVAVESESEARHLALPFDSRNVRELDRPSPSRIWTSLVEESTDGVRDQSRCTLAAPCRLSDENSRGKAQNVCRDSSAGPLCSWGALCPGQHERAGKRRRGTTRTGHRYWRGTLIQAGLGAMRKNGSALQARYHRIARHRGHKKAVVAVGHPILEIAFSIMRDGVTDEELGAD